MRPLFDFMLINHPHQFVTNAKTLVESNTFVKWDCRNIDSLSVFVPKGNKQWPKVS